METATIFKTAMASARDLLDIKPRVFFRNVDLESFELDTDFSLHPKEIAASALDQLSSRNGDIFDRAVCLAVIDFLDETVGPPREDADRTMRMTALRDILINPGTRSEYLRWAESWYD